MTEDHKEIWLECKCGDFSYEGRQWCGHDVFECSDHGPECKGSVKYIRADLHDALRAENKQLLGTLEYIEAQARLGYPTVLSVIIANAKAARNRGFQKAVSDAFAALERKPE